MEKRGLSQKEVVEKLNRYGYNEIRELFHVSKFEILLRQIKGNFIIYLLFILLINIF